IQQRLVASGAAAVNGTVTGALKSIDPNLTIALSDGFLSGVGIDPPLSNITLRAQVRYGALELERASADWGPATMNASGKIPFTPFSAALPFALPRLQGPAQFRAEVNELDLAAFGGAPKDLKGAVSALLEAQAARPELDSLNAKLTLPVLRASIGPYKLEQKGATTTTTTNG